jgi:IPT/TIG domain
MTSASRPSRRLAPAGAALAVLATSLVPVVARALPAAAAASMHSFQVHGAPAHLGRLAAGSHANVNPPPLRRPSRPGSTSVATSATYPRVGSGGHRSVDAEPATSTSGPRVATSGPTTVAQFSNIAGITHSGEHTSLGVDATPPDTQIAVSPTQVVEAVNTAALVMDHSGGSASEYDLATVWNTLEPGIESTQSISDPRIVWDAESQRWFVSMVIYDDALFASTGQAASAHSWIGLAVSTGTAPTAWTAYVLQSPAGILLDQPILGVNSDKITASSDNFDFTSASTPFVGSQLWVANKAEMLSAAATLDVAASNADANAFGYAPAVSRSATTTEYVAYNNFGAQPQAVSVIALDGVPGVSTVTMTQHDIVICPPPTCAATDPQTGIPPAVAQPGSGVTVDAGDDRMDNAVWKNGRLYTAGSTGFDIGLGPQSALYVAAVDTGPLTLHDFDYLYSALGTSFTFPGVDVDANGLEFISFSRGSSSTYMSAGAFAYNVSTGALMSAGILHGGAGTSWYDCGCGTPARWGDYNGAAVDPANPREVWTAGEFAATASAHDNWGTVLNRLTVSAPTISAVSAHSSRTDGGTTVTVTGSEFDPASTTVFFGGAAGTTAQWLDDRHVVAISPPHAAGAVDVVTGTVFGSSGPLSNAFAYLEPPISPGYWMVARDGGIFPFADALNHSYGSTGGQHLNAPIVGMAPTHSGNGYLLVASDGGIFPFGDGIHHSYGSTGNIRLNQPIVGMAMTRSGNGYWLVAADGGIFPFGDALQHSYGSTGGIRLNQPILGMVRTASGNGYWLVARDGGIFPFGDAVFHSYGSTGGIHLNQPIVGMAALTDGNGYWLVAADGGIFPFGEAVGHSYGSTGNVRLNQPIVAMVQTGDDGGYWLVASDGGTFPFGDAVQHSYGSLGNVRLNQPIVGMAAQPT